MDQTKPLFIEAKGVDSILREQGFRTEFRLFQDGAAIDDTQLTPETKEELAASFTGFPAVYVNGKLSGSKSSKKKRRD